MPPTRARAKRVRLSSPNRVVWARRSRRAGEEAIQLATQACSKQCNVGNQLGAGDRAGVALAWEATSQRVLAHG